MDVQRGREGSTYELYRAALQLRRRHELGAGDLVWTPEPRTDPAVLTFANNGVVVVANLGETPVQLPAGADVLVASGPLAHGQDGGTVVPAATTAWVALG